MMPVPDELSSSGSGFSSFPRFQQESSFSKPNPLWGVGGVTPKESRRTRFCMCSAPVFCRCSAPGVGFCTLCSACVRRCSCVLLVCCVLCVLRLCCALCSACVLLVFGCSAGYFGRDPPTVGAGWSWGWGVGAGLGGYG
jgi:hypothetical protein